MVELSDQFGKPYFTGGGQGKFFKDPKPVDQHRYQRGYTPDRMREVQNATWASMDGPPHLQAHLNQVVARSTMPTDVLHHQVDTLNLHEGAPMGHHAGVTATHLERSGLGGYTSSSNVDIFQAPHTPGMGISARAKGASQAEKMGTTIIHELGHAHHAFSDLDDFGGMGATKKGSGHREHYADTFANTHYRPDPREVRKGREAHAEDFSYPALLGQSRMIGYKGWSAAQKQAQSLRRGEREPISFVDEHSGDHWSEHKSGWHVQSALFNDQRDNGGE